MNKQLLTVFALLLSANINVANFKGIVRDKFTGEPLIGSSIVIKEVPKNLTQSGLDGSFSLNVSNVTQQTVTIVCSCVGYVSQVVELPLTAEIDKLNIDLVPKENAIGLATVKGRLQQNTESSARLIEMNSAQEINVMSSQSIQLSPDLDVAGVLQRMSGVVMDKGNTGEGQYAVLRGMDKRYNYSLVNGTKIPSPNNKDRYVPLDLFPAELLDRLEVVKSLTPDMEADATGGVVNMVMKDAPAELFFQVHAATGYNSSLFKNDFTKSGTHFANKSPREIYGSTYKASISDFSQSPINLSKGRALPDLNAGLCFGNRFLKNRLGLMLAGSYRSENRITKGILFMDEMSQSESTVRVTQYNRRTYSEQTSQYGAHLKLDYDLSDNGKLAWYNSFIGSTAYQIRQADKTDLVLNYAPDKGNLLEDISTRSRKTAQGIFSSTLKGKHSIGEHFTLDWTGVFADAVNKRPDNTMVSLERSTENYQSFTTADDAERRYEHNSDRNWAGHLNASYNTKIRNIETELKVGGLYRAKTRENRYISYTFTPAGSTRPVEGVDFNSIDEIAWKVSTPLGCINALNYNSNENIGATYVQLKLSNKLGHIFFGVRGEHTDQEYSMVYPTSSEFPKGNQKYWDFLPSIHVKYRINDKMNARMSYFRSINRPGFFEIVPYTIINEDYTEYGNKDLKRAQIDNVDLRWEWFSKPTEQLLIGTFWKYIKNPIEYAYYSRNGRQYGYGPANLGNATNAGFEMDFTKYIRNFGIKANYTYTYSSITTPKTTYQRIDGKLTRREVNQKRSLVGQAPHVANISLLYKDSHHGWNAQLSGAFMSEKIAVASHYLNSDYYDNARFTLDFSAEKNWPLGISLYMKATNLFNTHSKQYIKTSNEANLKYPEQNLSGKTLIRDNNSGTNFLFGIRYTLR